MAAGCGGLGQIFFMRQLLLYLFSFHIISASAQGLTDKQLVKEADRLAGDKISATEPGMAILIARKEKTVMEKAWGMANLELGVKLMPDHVFRIGSVTKTFTATAVLQLVEQGRLRLEDTLQKYLPEYPFGNMPVTIEQLLTHTSGIRDYMSKGHPDPFILRHDLQPGELIAHIKNEPLSGLPGERFNYSNSNYVLLGLIIEKITGMSYHDYVRTYLLKPAGLSRSSFAGEKEIIPGRIPGYWSDEKTTENCGYQSLSIGYACGDLLSTADDLYRWCRALFTGKIIRDSLLRRAVSPFRLGNGRYSAYGYGWMIDTIEGRVCYRHDGSVSGFGAELRYFPAEEICLVFLTNTRSDRNDAQAGETIKSVTRMVLGGPSRKEIKIDKEKMQELAGLYAANEQSAIRVTVEGGQMYIEGTNPADNMSKMPVQAISPLLWFVKGTDLDLQFVKDAGGRIVQLVTVYKNKVRIEWKRVE